MPVQHTCRHGDNLTGSSRRGELEEEPTRVLFELCWQHEGGQGYAIPRQNFEAFKRGVAPLSSDLRAVGHDGGPVQLHISSAS